MNTKYNFEYLTIRMYFSSMYLPSIRFLSTYAPIATITKEPLVRIRHTDDFFKLWTSLEIQSGKMCDVPFWAIAWPAARSLCHFIGNNTNLVKGKSILDLGCGCGIVGISAKKNGAITATLNDIDPLAIHVSQINAKLNDVECVYVNGELSLSDPENLFDVIFIADCFYEKTGSSRLHNTLLKQVEKGVEVIIADAHRPFTPGNDSVFLSKEVFDVDFAVEGVHRREVDIFRLTL